MVTTIRHASSNLQFAAVFYENGRSSETRSRGNEPFVAVSWEQAERIVADTLQSIKKQYGNEAIFAGSYGWASAGMFHHAPSQLHRFLNCFGGFYLLGEFVQLCGRRSHCAACHWQFSSTASQQHRVAHPLLKVLTCLSPLVACR